MEETKRWPGWLRAFSAVIVALWVFGVYFPSIARTVVDNTTNPPTEILRAGPLELGILLGVIVVPLLCVLIRIRRRHGVEYLGWGLLFALLAATFSL